MAGKVGLGMGVVLAAFLGLLPALPDEARSPAAAPDKANVLAPEVLAREVLRGTEKVLIVDVREEELWLKENIRGSFSMPISTMDEASIRALPEHRKIVLYGADERDSRLAWTIFSVHHPQAAILRGGFAAWKSGVLNPVAPAPDAPAAEWEGHRRRTSVANYFLGRSEGATVESPAQSARPAPRPRRSSARTEGC